jgi:hypothetical protein
MFNVQDTMRQPQIHALAGLESAIPRQEYDFGGLKSTIFQTDMWEAYMELFA